MDAKQRYREIKRISIIGAIINAVVGIIKIVFGTLGHSYALVADGVHSLSDLLTDLLVIVASYFGSQHADKQHPYGHRRIETAATLFLALLLSFVGAAIIYDAVIHIADDVPNQLSMNVLWIVVASIIIKELLYQYTRYVAIRTSSELLHANAWHHRSDAASSIVVLIGVIGSLLGYVFLDAVAAVFVGILIIYMGWKLSWSSIQELIDTAVDENTLMQIKQIIINISGVTALHQLRTRLMGGNILIDVHINVNPNISVSEGHYIAQQVHYVLTKQIEAVVDVTVHIDPEADELAALNLQLPPREILMEQLNEAYKNLPEFDRLDNIAMHYLAGKIHLDIYFKPRVNNDEITIQALACQYKDTVKSLSYIGNVHLFVSVSRA